MSSAKIIYFADVYCPWCYSFAPSVLRLAREYADIPVHVVGGSLIAQPTSLLWLRMREPGLGQFWSGVQEQSGRSFAGILADLAGQKDVRMDSIGADALFIALSNLAPGHELEQFTELEDMFFEKGLDLFAEETVAALAGQWQVSEEKLSTMAADAGLRDEAEREIEAVTQMLGGSVAFPTVFLMRGDSGETASQGYVPYETVAARMADAVNDLHLEPLAPHERMSRR